MKNKKIFLKKVSSKNKQDQDQEMLGDKARVKNNVRILKTEIKGFIRCLVQQLLTFYAIELRKNDIKRDLAENMVTNIVMKDEIYVIMFRLYSELYEDDIQVLKRLQDNPALLEEKLSLAALNVKPQFCLDQAVRAAYEYKGDHAPAEYKLAPYA